MQITCPQCSTQFNIPDNALVGGGRTLKCAKCQHKWLQTAPSSGPATPPPPVEPPPAVPVTLPPVTLPPVTLPPLPPIKLPPVVVPTGDNALSLEEPSVAFKLPPLPTLPEIDFSLDRENPRRGAAKPAVGLDLDLLSKLSPDPAAKPSPEELSFNGLTERVRGGEEIGSGRPPLRSAPGKPPLRGRKSKTGWWIFLLLLTLVLGGAAAGAYIYQNHIISLWPKFADILDDLGLRTAPGSGLSVVKMKDPQRVSEGKTEFLLVFGKISNISDRERVVPSLLMRLIDVDGTTIQNELFDPPVKSLGVGQSKEFILQLKSPHSAATRVDLDFVRPVEEKPSLVESPASSMGTSNINPPASVHPPAGMSPPGPSGSAPAVPPPGEIPMPTPAPSPPAPSPPPPAPSPPAEGTVPPLPPAMH